MRCTCTLTSFTNRCPSLFSNALAESTAPGRQGRRPPPTSVARHLVKFWPGRARALRGRALPRRRRPPWRTRAWSCDAPGRSTPARAGPSATSSPSSTHSKPPAAPRPPRPSSSSRSGLAVAAQGRRPL